VAFWSEKSRLGLRGLAGWCLLGASVSCASTGPDPATRFASSAISGGQPDSGDENVFILISHRGQQGVALCSASLIAPNLLLTARHCVSEVTQEQVTCGQTTAGSPFPTSSFLAANTASIDQITAANAFHVAAVSVPTEGADICGFDLALVTLESSVPANVAQPLVPRIDRPVTTGERYTAVGYGQTSGDDADVGGERRLRSGLKVGCSPGECGAGVEADEFVGQAGICSGDSGGPALDSDGKLIGVVSRSADDCSFPVYGAVAAWKDWLIQVATQAAMSGGYAAPTWVTTGSSDVPAAAAGAAGSAGAEESGTGGDTGGAAPASSSAQGDQCSTQLPCSAGFDCYSPTGTDSPSAYCAASCTEQSQCQGGTECIEVATTQRVCLAASVSAESSCAVGAAGRSGSGHATPLGLLGLACLSRKRRRPSRLRRSRCAVS
jgi:hypothetical protein